MRRMQQAWFGSLLAVTAGQDMTLSPNRRGLRNCQFIKTLPN
jgi:hypothetical protein